MGDAAGNEGEDFIYTGRESDIILGNVTRVRVDRNIRAIKAEAFQNCTHLAHVYLGDCDCKGLKKIGERAFAGCTSLREILIPPTNRVIQEGEFRGCSELTIVFLSEGLEEFGAYAFRRCTLLRDIVIPPAVKVIHEGAFRGCSELTIVFLGKGLEEIGVYAFC
jgi:hypothetical protein